MLKNQGFTLLELSIVLVIIGLIAGGIVAGSAMIRSAELRAVVTEHEQFQIGVHTFKDKYLGLPGDLKNATDFWGVAHATPATCATTQGTGTETCDGDGDGSIDISAGSNESYRFWQHLANAGLVAGTFTGIEGSAGNSGDSAIGVNVPESKSNNNGWTMIDWDNSGGTFTNTIFQMDFGNHYHIGWDCGTSCQSSGDDYTPEEAWNIDKKIDDGLPTKGKFVTVRWSSCTTATLKSELDVVYDLAFTDSHCTPAFIKQF
jgi:prepilin-type N-terminal cleavage/methylation domain-containing protein